VLRVVGQEVVVVLGDCKSWAVVSEIVTGLARAERTNKSKVSHHLGSSLDVDLHARRLEPLDNDAHSTKARDKVERSDDSELEEVSVLKKRG
jgi:hypothetical protein